jgi:splicing factor 45
LLEFCSRDTTTVRITYTCGGGCKELIVASAYLPYDSDEPPPTKEERGIIEYCHSRKKQLNIGCDANAHHKLWGSNGSNPRRESLMEFLVSSNLNILNHGNEPTFVVCNRREVIDLTLGTNKNKTW